MWLRAQRLDTVAPFGSDVEATRAAVEHLGYVQIDSINVIERCHHHILFTRIPDYQRAHLDRTQSVDKSVFEYWTHALSYVPTRDLRFFLPAMNAHRRTPRRSFAQVTSAELRKVLRLIGTSGPLSIRDIEDDVLVEKAHPWASRQPSNRALRMAFHSGMVTIANRNGMLKSYELMDRHFGWRNSTSRPEAALPSEVVDYLLERALRSQGLVSLDSICHLDTPRKASVRRQIEAWRRRGDLVRVRSMALETRNTGQEPRHSMARQSHWPSSFTSCRRSIR